jgi:hypothetical protein
MPFKNGGKCRNGGKLKKCAKLPGAFRSVAITTPTTTTTRAENNVHGPLYIFLFLDEPASLAQGKKSETGGGGGRGGEGET